MSNKRILIIDDDRAICSSLKLLLSRSGYEVRAIHHPQVAIETLEEYRPHLVVLDMNFSIDTSGRQGLKMLRLLLEAQPSLSVILITGWATLQLAVEGMKIGAKDFIAKPWDNKHMLSSIQTILDLYHVDDELPSDKTDGMIIGESASLRLVMEMVDRVAATDASVLITGESGTGKELIAEAIHAKSRRASQEFVKVNLGGISASLFESEMFGHVKGAYTGALSDRQGRFSIAHGGSIFLDEIGELGLDEQVKLLRVLQEKTYEVLGSSKSKKTDVRVISATNRPLQQMIGEGAFREDLYYRINLIEIHLPPLRERQEDIPLLAKHFLGKVEQLYGITPPPVDDEALQWLRKQEFPGNIRQFKNLMERTALLHSQDQWLTVKAFQKIMNTSSAKSSDKVALPEVGSITLEELESQMIQKALNYHNQSISATARALGLTRSSLYRRMEKYGIGE